MFYKLNELLKIDERQLAVWGNVLMVAEHNMIAFRCHFCGKIFIQVHMLVEHIHQVHRDDGEASVKNPQHATPKERNKNVLIELSQSHEKGVEPLPEDIVKNSAEFIGKNVNPQNESVDQHCTLKEDSSPKENSKDFLEEDIQKEVHEEEKTVNKQIEILEALKDCDISPDMLEGLYGRTEEIDMESNEIEHNYAKTTNESQERTEQKRNKIKLPARKKGIALMKKLRKIPEYNRELQMLTLRIFQRRAEQRQSRLRKPMFKKSPLKEDVKKTIAKDTNTNDPEKPKAQNNTEYIGLGSIERCNSPLKDEVEQNKSTNVQIKNIQKVYTNKAKSTEKSVTYASVEKITSASTPTVEPKANQSEENRFITPEHKRNEDVRSQTDKTESLRNTKTKRIATNTNPIPCDKPAATDTMNETMLEIEICADANKIPGFKAHVILPSPDRDSTTGQMEVEIADENEIEVLSSTDIRGNEKQQEKPSTSAQISGSTPALKPQRSAKSIVRLRPLISKHDASGKNSFDNRKSARKKELRALKSLILDAITLNTDCDEENSNSEMDKSSMETENSATNRSAEQTPQANKRRKVQVVQPTQKTTNANALIKEDHEIELGDVGFTESNVDMSESEVLPNEYNVNDDLVLLDKVGLKQMHFNFVVSHAVEPGELMPYKASIFTHLLRRQTVIWNPKNHKSKSMAKREIAFAKLTKQAKSAFNDNLTKENVKRIFNIIKIWYEKSTDFLQNPMDQSILKSQYYLLLLFSFLPQTKPIVLYCEYCPERFENPDAYEEHRLTHTDYQPHLYDCENCGLMFNKEEKFEAHRLQCDQVLKCDEDNSVQ